MEQNSDPIYEPTSAEADGSAATGRALRSQYGARLKQAAKQLRCSVRSVILVRRKLISVIQITVLEKLG
jgi:hypothetical protein